MVCVYVCVYLLQGFVSIYGFGARAYWLFIPLVMGIYSTSVVLEESVLLNNKTFQSFVLIIGTAVLFLVVRGAYRYIYRDMPYKELTTSVESGVWKGCYTTHDRAEMLVKLEQELQSRTTENDQVLCWGRWACFMNLMTNGKLCSASPLGSGQKNGFDFWHMYQTVPNKVFVNIDEDDVNELQSDKYAIWVFIEKFYEKTNEISYLSYDQKGDPIKLCITEYKVSDSAGALSYADEKASEVFSFR